MRVIMIRGWRRVPLAIIRVPLVRLPARVVRLVPLGEQSQVTPALVMLALSTMELLPVLLATTRAQPAQLAARIARAVRALIEGRFQGLIVHAMMGITTTERLFARLAVFRVRLAPR
jgi:hypothetical protein